MESHKNVPKHQPELDGSEPSPRVSFQVNSKGRTAESCVSLQMRSESHPQASTLRIQADSTKPRMISNNNSQTIILIGGFNPSEKYDFVSWDDYIPN
jgi:hypothetical protein